MAFSKSFTKESNLRLLRGGSRAAVTSKMERFVIIANGWKPLTIITKHSILDIAAILDPPLSIDLNSVNWYECEFRSTDCLLQTNNI